MIRRILSFAVLCGLMLIAVTASVTAQTALSAAGPDTLGRMQTAVSKAIGAQVRTVEITTDGGVLVVARVNSNMNASTHEGRNNEARKIATLVARSLGDKTRFGTVSTIRVDYTVRAVAAPAGKVLDSVEFRRGPDGVFDFHQT
jgi:hypothetical protein